LSLFSCFLDVALNNISRHIKLLYFLKYSSQGWICWCIWSTFFNTVDFSSMKGANLASSKKKVAWKACIRWLLDPKRKTRR
jgi:hypothetical protein